MPAKFLPDDAKDRRGVGAIRWVGGKPPGLAVALQAARIKIAHSGILPD
ncbi:MAG: hypothetical protein R3E18_12875 [Sphingomonadaceae bacterium]|nr:hypothetical protein [Sphingomonadaceae bacterium]